MKSRLSKLAAFEPSTARKTLKVETEQAALNTLVESKQEVFYKGILKCPMSTTEEAGQV